MKNLLGKRNQGIIFIIASAFFFALMNLFVRLSGDLPTMQKVFFRNFVAMLVALVLVLKDRSAFKIGKGNFKYVLLRSIAGTLGMICNFYAIDRLNIADASILNKISPFFAIVFSFFILKEKPAVFDWIAVAVAFIGAVFVVNPVFSLEVLPAIAGVAGGLGAGLAYTFLRKATMNGVKGKLVVFFFSAFSCAVALPFLIIFYQPMSGLQLIYLLLSGAAAAGGQLCITAAYTKAPAKEISVFDYTIVLFTSVFGFCFLEQVPSVMSIIGYVIIIGIAVVKWLYNLKKDKGKEKNVAASDAEEKKE